MIPIHSAERFIYSLDAYLVASCENKYYSYIQGRAQDMTRPSCACTQPITVLIVLISQFLACPVHTHECTIYCCLYKKKLWMYGHCTGLEMYLRTKNVRVPIYYRHAWVLDLYVFLILLNT